MARNDTQYVQLDKKSLDAINGLRKAIEDQNRLERRRQKNEAPYTAKTPLREPAVGGYSYEWPAQGVWTSRHPQSPPKDTPAPGEGADWTDR